MTLRLASLATKYSPLGEKEQAVIGPKWSQSAACSKVLVESLNLYTCT